MKIKELYIKNHENGWELERTSFGDLTLLVGASGVGKTQILKYIEKLVEISKGKHFPGVQWDIKFTSENGSHYRWTGHYDVLDEDLHGHQKPSLKEEKLFLANKLIFKRELSNVEFEGNAVPKISSHSSVLSIFVDEDSIKPVKLAFDMIQMLDTTAGEQMRTYLDSTKVYKLYESIPYKLEKPDLDMIKKLNTHVAAKLLIAEIVDKDLFKEIIHTFQNIFPQVEDVRHMLIKKDEAYLLQIKEKGTDWISFHDISAGMYKTLLHIAQLKLMADGYVILIDELENSLGVNCLDTVAGNLLAPGGDIQYILTSHHPYIINNIDMKHWKVVTRKGSRVSTQNVEQLKLSKSKHEAFKQLLNLEEFTEGIS